MTTTRRCADGVRRQKRAARRCGVTPSTSKNRAVTVCAGDLLGRAVGAADRSCRRSANAAIASKLRFCSFQSRKSSGDACDVKPLARRLPHHDQAIGGSRERQRPEKRRVGEREHRAVGADAERQRECGDRP